jgi:hypothetical protein
MNKFRLHVAASILMLVAGCVTINIYFPAAAAEKAADKIIDDVWQAQKGGQKPEPAQRPDQPAPPETKK